MHNLKAGLSQNEIYKLDLDKTKILFTNCLKSRYDTSEIFIFYLKLFIWRSRCLQSPLNHECFQRFFNFEIEILKDAFQNNLEIQKLELLDLST